MQPILEGRRALVTGAATGIGAAIARTFAAAGARVAVHARSVARAEPTVAAIRATGGAAQAVAADLTDPGAIPALCASVLEVLGGIDIVVNNAGIAEKAGLVETSAGMWDRIMNVNLKAPFLITQGLVPAMRAARRGGRCIFISSVAAKLPDPHGAAYNASKAGLDGLMRCLAAELGADAITVNAILPGWIDTPMAETLHRAMPGSETDFETYYDRSVRSNLLGARIEPHDVAAAALFLASDAARHITAQTLNVCAGLCVS